MRNVGYQLSAISSQQRNRERVFLNFRAFLGKTALFLSLICVHLCSSVVPTARAAGLTTGADFLSVTTGARPDGMGQAFSAVADDINALSLNPAGLSRISKPEIGYGRVSFVSDVHFDFVGVAVPFGETGVAGLSYSGMGVAPFNSTANSGAALVSAGDLALTGGFAKKFNELRLGASLKYLSRQVGPAQGSGFAFDAGCQYPVTPKITAAAVLRNMGPGVQFAGNESMPTVFNLGGAWTVLEKDQHQLTAALEGSFNLSTSIQRYSLGAEYWFNQQFAARAGYLLNSPVEGISAGVGVRFQSFEIDYSFRPYDQLGLSHRFSGSFRWDAPWLAQAPAKADPTKTAKPKNDSKRSNEGSK